MDSVEGKVASLPEVTSPQRFHSPRNFASVFAVTDKHHVSRTETSSLQTDYEAILLQTAVLLESEINIV